jgi:hypothetical protein
MQRVAYINVLVEKLQSKLQQEKQIMEENKAQAQKLRKTLNKLQADITNLGTPQTHPSELELKLAEVLGNVLSLMGDCHDNSTLSKLPDTLEQIVNVFKKQERKLKKDAVMRNAYKEQIAAVKVKRASKKPRALKRKRREEIEGREIETNEKTEFSEILESGFLENVFTVPTREKRKRSAEGRAYDDISNQNDQSAQEKSSKRQKTAWI